MSKKSNSSVGLPKELKEDQIKFWLSNTNLSREQLLAWYKSFQEYSEKTDKLDKANFVKYYEKLESNNSDSEGFYKLAFKAFDKDNSGFIDFHEFLVAFNIFGNGNMNDRLNLMFDIYDQNKDNLIDRKEFDTIVKAILKMNKKQLTGDQTLETKLDEMFEKLDDNENDEITRDEFVNNCSNNRFIRDILAPKF